MTDTAPAAPLAAVPARKRPVRIREAREYGGFVRRAIRGLSARAEHEDAAAVLSELVTASTALDAALRDAVDRLRAQGYSWAEIGALLNTSRQGAQQRFGRAR
jgi:DNA-directed RNA polymerase specialized sigma24 family protein